MPSCTYCKKRIASKRLRCKDCKISLHKVCVTRYLNSPLPSGRGPSTAGASSLVAIPLAGARAHAIDAHHGIDPNLTLSDSSFNITTSSPTKPKAPYCLNAAYNDRMDPSSNTEALLPNWSQMSSAECDAIMFYLLTENKASIQAVVSKVSEMTVTAADHSTCLDALEQGSCRYEEEIRDLKVVHRAVPVPEIKINAIPSPCIAPAVDLSHKLLDFLALQLLKNDMKVVRIHEMRDVTSASTQAPSNDFDNQIMSHLSHEYRILFYSSCDINPPYSYFIYLCIFNDSWKLL